eukprot:TRINITY_DN12879_c0_g1_i1.p1 TRINITY_DN12879_c0_g1~~TRINITY_DN12879_c0_g1_i1.p1  ORF type:complete len:578 (+),score=125.82 TRINITY_DN12879_c0_g1_i1:49-1734(+)
MAIAAAEAAAAAPCLGGDCEDVEDPAAPLTTPLSEDCRSASQPFARRAVVAVALAAGLAGLAAALVAVAPDAARVSSPRPTASRSSGPLAGSTWDWLADGHTSAGTLRLLPQGQVQWMGLRLSAAHGYSWTADGEGGLNVTLGGQRHRLRVDSTASGREARALDDDDDESPSALPTAASAAPRLRSLRMRRVEAPIVEGRGCSADLGAQVPGPACCGQPGGVSAGMYLCGAARPKCRSYVQGSWLGYCAPEDAPAHPAAGSMPGALAVLIPGLRKRLVLRPTLDNVISPNAKAGLAVHVYASLVTTGATGKRWVKNEAAASEDPTLADLDSSEFEAKVREEVESAGGKLAYLRQLPGGEVLDPLPKFALKRWPQYPPSTSDIGKNVLRRYQSSEFLWNQTRAYEEKHGFRYSFVLLSRDDAYWLGPVLIPSFVRPAGDYLGPARIFTRSCALFWGFNDKVAMLERAAAEAWLPLYSSFYHDSDDSLERSQGAEAFALQLIRLKGLAHYEVPFSQLPSLDSQFEVSNGNAAVCIKPFYIRNCVAKLPKSAPDECHVYKHDLA